MLQKKLSKNGEGFTIIEVLIVLAVAALILLIVFLAVPALQRNARNTQRSNDVAGIVGAYNEWVENNGGSPPAALTAAQCNALGNFCVNVKTGFYTDGTQISFQGPTNAGALNGAPTLTTVVGGSDVTCNANGTAAMAGVSANEAAFVYDLENGSGAAVPECKTAG